MSISVTPAKAGVQRLLLTQEHTTTLDSSHWNDKLALPLAPVEIMGQSNLRCA
jgi:hypothetical protein